MGLHMIKRTRKSFNTFNCKGYKREVRNIRLKITGITGLQ